VQAKFVNLTTQGKKRVLLLNPRREEVVSAYHAADLFVFGSTIECSPIVLFEAAASRTPFLSSDCGNAREIAEWTGGGRILSAITAAEMAKGIEDMLSDKPLLKSMAESGFHAWKSRFTWQDIASQYEEVYKQVAVAAH
jgi:glycosyltransferase involved in cell wall biosynthesis